jgi:predicted nuclease of predicted toxin-antitoxin system
LKLLFDQNLAPRLVARLADLFPGSEHVRDVGLVAADDRAVWEYAKAGGFAIVSKDADFRQLSFLYASPPKVVWLRVGNRSTVEIEAIVRAHAGDFEAFDTDPVASMLVVTA